MFKLRPNPKGDAESTTVNTTLRVLNATSNQARTIKMEQHIPWDWAVPHSAAATMATKTASLCMVGWEMRGGRRWVIRKCMHWAVGADGQREST